MPTPMSSRHRRHLYRDPEEVVLPVMCANAVATGEWHTVLISRWLELEHVEF
jgi:hypothetical protein